MAKAAGGSAPAGRNNSNNSSNNKESASTGVALPKFGEWDVNNPASAEGFTVIFNKARDDKKTNKAAAGAAAPAQIVDSQNDANDEYESPTFNKNEPYHPPDSSRKLKWLCCG